MKSTKLLNTFWAALSASALVMGLAFAGGSYRSSEIIDAGPTVTWSNQLLNLLTVVIGLLITGIVTTYGFLVNQNGKQISDFAKSKIIL
ncbi:MAG: hypothetical protein KGQ38_04215, partial [Actinomycetales bacterium]|nr:hypothetical protein [Actinomycetales bacterium]